MVVYLSLQSWYSHSLVIPEAPQFYFEVALTSSNILCPYTVQIIFP